MTRVPGNRIGCLPAHDVSATNTCYKTHFYEWLFVFILLSANLQLARLDYRLFDFCGFHSACFLSFFPFATVWVCTFLLLYFIKNEEIKHFKSQVDL